MPILQIPTNVVNANGQGIIPFFFWVELLNVVGLKCLDEVAGEILVDAKCSEIGIAKESNELLRHIDFNHVIDQSVKTWVHVDVQAHVDILENIFPHVDVHEEIPLC